MSRWPVVPEQPRSPIFRVGATPIAYEVLGLQLHLDELRVEDETRLDEAMKYVADWIGGQLKWSITTIDKEVEPFDVDVLGYVPTYPRLLRIGDDDRGASPSAILSLLAPQAMDYGVACGCTPPADHEHAQLTTFRFYADVSRYFPENDHLSGYSVMRVTVPADTPLLEFQAHCRELAKLLPVRWGSAGLMLSGAEDAYYNQWKRAAYAYCRRYACVDHGAYIVWMDEFYDRIRTVNWLTYLGPTMRRDLAYNKGALHEASGVAQTSLGDSDLVELQAGSAPGRGDVNRLLVPREYVAVDAMLRHIRHDGSEVCFNAPWTSQTTEQWMTRFERVRTR